MEYLESLNKSWIEILMEPSSKNILTLPKTKALNDLFETLEEIRKLNVSFDHLGINFYELDLMPLQDALFEHNYKLVDELKGKIKNDLSNLLNESEIKDMLLEYKSLLEELESYAISDLYKIEKDIEGMSEENFDDIFSKKEVLEGLNSIIEAMRQEGAIAKDLGNEQNIVAEFKEIYDAYYFEVVKAKNIVDFLSSII